MDNLIVSTEALAQKERKNRPEQVRKEQGLFSLFPWPVPCFFSPTLRPYVRFHFLAHTGPAHWSYRLILYTGQCFVTKGDFAPGRHLKMAEDISGHSQLG